ncbi:unnamed protein product [Symbiodinium sp. CCMP2456]|nr:unnamed protein product [Symbiodinium sp. CCMP2456]
MSLEPRSRSPCEEDGGAAATAAATATEPPEPPRSRRGRPVRWRPERESATSEVPPKSPSRLRLGEEVFARLYRDASSKQQALAQWAQDKERREREAFARSMQASEKTVQEICERMHKDQRKQPCAQDDSQKYMPVQESAAPTLSVKEQRIFLQKQKNWNQQRERRTQAQREERSEAERQYLEDHSIHKKVSKESVSDVLACCHRLYKDGWQRTRRLQRLQESAQEELCLSIEANQVHRAARGRAASAPPRAASRPAGGEVACMRLHQDSEDRRRRVEQKRREQDEFIRQQARPKKDRTPRPSVSPRSTQRAETDRKAKSPQSPATATTATATESPLSAVSPVSSGTSTSARSSRLQGEKGSVSEKTRSAAETETESRVEVEVGVLGLLGASGDPGPGKGCLTYCEVLTRGLALLRTRAAESFLWDESVRASVLTTDTLLFKIYAQSLSDRCLAEASLEVKSILRLCSSGFEGKLRMWCQSEASWFPCEPYLHVTLRSAGVQQGLGPAAPTRGKNCIRQTAHRGCPEGREVTVQAEAKGSTTATTSQARNGHVEQLRYPCLMSRPIEVLPRTADEDGLLASSSTFLPLRKKLTLSRKQAREASEGGCEFEVCMLLPEAVTSPSPCFRVQIPGEWLPDHLREPRDEQEENGSENATKSGPEEVLFFFRQGRPADAHQVQFELPSQITRLTAPQPTTAKAPLRRPRRASPSDSSRRESAAPDTVCMAVDLSTGWDGTGRPRAWHSVFLARPWTWSGLSGSELDEREEPDEPGLLQGEVQRVLSDDEWLGLGAGARKKKAAKAASRAEQLSQRGAPRCLLGPGSEVSFGAEAEAQKLQPGGLERSEQGEESEGSAEASLPSPDAEMERAIQREIQHSFGTSMASTEGRRDPYPHRFSFIVSQHR